MPLLFYQFCDLLQALEDISRHDPPYLATERQRRCRLVIQNWFLSHGISLICMKVEPAVLLSLLFPESRSDRIFGLRVKRLSQQLRRYLSLGQGRWQQLNLYLTPGNGDLGDCVERVLSQAENPQQHASRAVSVTQIDDALGQIAANCRFSAEEVKRTVSSPKDTPSILGPLYIRLQSREAKWLTRLLLKDFSAVDLALYKFHVYSCIDRQLPLAMQMYDNFEAAISALRSMSVSTPEPASDLSRSAATVTNLLQPKVGVKVSPPRWVKAKGGIDHAISLAGQRCMSIEKKFDGEYCQIHIDLDKGKDAFQIFSKSGRDSTEDRKALIPALRQALRIGCVNQKFSAHCILEGELVVWDDIQGQVAEFHKIRRHVARNGVMIGNDNDSPPLAHEHLMLVLYDILQLDKQPTLHQSYKDRRWLLERTVDPVKGRVQLVEQIEVDFRKTDGPNVLKRALSEALALKWEGIVLKPMMETYFGTQEVDNTRGRYWIKLKKDCIRGYGDSADFAVVGAGFDAVRAAELNIRGLRWTHFFIGCLKNSKDVRSSGAKPEFVIVDCVTACINAADLSALNQLGTFAAVDVQHKDAASIMDFEMLSMDLALPRMQTIFRKPFIFDIAGSGFERASNRTLFTLRFPRVLKVRFDQDWKDCIDLDQLIMMAEEAREPRLLGLEDEIAKWEANLNLTSGKLNRIWPSQSSTDGDADKSVTPEGNRTMIMNRRTKRKAVTTFVRMDTGEIRTDEERFPSGMVEKRPRLERCNTDSEYAESGNTTRADPSWIKQSVYIEQSPGGLQEITPSSSNRSRRHWAPDGSSSPIHAENAPSAKIHAQEKPFRHGACQSTSPVDTREPRRASSVSIVAKIVPSCQRILPVGSRKAKIPTNISPDRLTSSDECSSAASSQIRTIYATASQPIPLRYHPPAIANAPPTPPPTAEVATKLALPDIPNCVIVMNTARKPSPSMQRFYRKNKARLRPLIRRLDDWENRTVDAVDKPDSSVLYILDSRDKPASCDDLIAIAKMTQQRQSSVSVWDWRLLRLLISEGKREVDEKDLLDVFVAHVQCEEGSQGGAKVVWHGGEVDIVSSADLQRHHNEREDSGMRAR